MQMQWMSVAGERTRASSP